MSNCAKIYKCDIVNGKGIRTSIFLSGCNHKCEGCFNKELWEFKDEDTPIEEITKRIENTIDDHISGISILGGEPLNEMNITTTHKICKWFKDKYKDKNIWVWTGYTYEELVSNDSVLSVIYFDTLKQIDVLVDGRFEIEKKDISLAFRGSSNQRVIDIQETLKNKKITLYKVDD